jgi:hypothetical protein
MKRPIAILAGAALLVLAGLLPAGAGEKPPVVVELYTSQGCSSCPPAEAFMRELAKRDDVIGLEFHVDYWDYIGWKDMFADPSFTKRQKRYVNALGARYAYTPQMVIGGNVHAVGSERDTVEQHIRAAQRTLREEPPITLRREGETLVIEIGEAKVSGTYDITFVTFDKPHTTKVRRGENRGQTLVNANVVRELAVVGKWSGNAATFRVSLAGKKGDGGCAVLVQNRGPGRVLTAARLPFEE